MSSETGPETDDFIRDGVADVTAWFAGVLLIVAASFDILQGLAAIANGDLYASGTDYLYQFDLTAWGTIHLVVGVLSLFVAYGILVRASWGQVTGMIVAGLAMLTNFAFLPFYPFWSIIVIAIYAGVIWALSVQLRKQS